MSWVSVLDGKSWVGRLGEGEERGGHDRSRLLFWEDMDGRCGSDDVDIGGMTML